MLELKAGIQPVNCTVKIDGSKSISNRLLILNEITGNRKIIKNLSASDDTRLLEEAIKTARNTFSANIDIGHAGSDMRFLTAFLSNKNGNWQLTGSKRMKERPIAPLVDALRSLGAEINYTGLEGFPPLLIKGKSLEGGSLEIDGSLSSQFISALVLSAPSFKNGLEIRIKNHVVSKPYIEMSLSLLNQFGVPARMENAIIRVETYGSEIVTSPGEITVESDWSSASYWFSICAFSKGSTLKLNSFNSKSLQADSVLPEIYSRLGVSSYFEGDTLILKNNGQHVQFFEYDFTPCPDIAQTLAVTCFGLKIPSRFSGLKTLRIKETDRIHALDVTLSKFGGTVNSSEDSLELKNFPEEFNSGSRIIETFNDHRMAMSFAPLSLLSRSLFIKDEAVVSKSYPGFWRDLKSAGFHVNLLP